MLDGPISRRLWRLLQTLRGTPLDVEQQVILSTQFATWVWLAATDKIPEALAPHGQPLAADEVGRIFRELRSLPALRDNGDAFIADDSLIHAVSEVVLGNLLYEARHLVEGGFIGAEFVDEVLTAVGSGAGRSSLFTMPHELVQLLIGLADIRPGDEVYMPFDDALQLSLAAAQAGARVSTEMPRYSPLPYLINLLTEQQIQVSAGCDPITHPTFVDGPRLRIFAKTVSFPPMGGRVPLETSDRDLYGRFRERTTSSTVLAVRHVLAQTKRRAVILAPNSLLFGAGAERSLRQDLVHGGLEAVIGLPPATLFGTSIPLAVLVMSLQEAAPRSEVLFVDGSAERFHKRDGKGRTTLTGWRELVEAVNQRLAGDHATAVPSQVIKENDYQLMVSRYARSQLIDAVDEALREGEAVRLEDLVEFIRPLPVGAAGSTEDLPVEALEVGVADLPEYGYIRNPQKRVRLVALKNELRPLDILITVKGSVGKVGIVPPHLDETWVAGQSCLILRLRDGRRAHPLHTPHSLLLYLRSAMGKASLGRIASGSAVPLIQLRELRKLLVIIPPLQEQAAAEQAFGQLVTLEQQIEDLRAQQQQLASRFWPLPLLANAETT
jgi:type I restriction enzyme M protein